MQQAQHSPTLTSTNSLKYLHKLILHNITEIKHITHPNGTHLMTNDEFKHYYTTPTKTTKAALDLARSLFCEPPCQNPCQYNCPTHILPNTLKTIYKIQHHNIATGTNRHQAPPPPPPPPEYPKPPLHIQHNHHQYPIHSILNDRPHTSKDKNQIEKSYTSYQCQWLLPNDITYNKWLP